MTIIVFLIDTSASMCQRTYMGGRPTLLDIAKGAVESFVKVRQRSSESRGDRYMLLTFEEPPANIKAGWKENIGAFMNQLKNLRCAEMTTLGLALKNVFDILNINRMQSGIDTYGQGRSPFFLEPCIIVVITDGGRLSNASNVVDEFNLPMTNPIPGWEMTREPFRWDQRLFSLVLRMSGTPTVDRDTGLVANDTSPIDAMCEVTGGRSYCITSQRVLMQCIDSLVQKIQSGVVINFEKIGPEPLPIIDKENGMDIDIGYEEFGKIGFGNTDHINHQNGNKVNGIPNVVQPPSNAWHNCRKLIHVPKSAQKGFPMGFWPIPESYWPENTMNSLPPRCAHPTVKFSCVNQEPMVIESLPFDKYELEPCPLTQFILSRKQPTLCWQVFVANSYKTPEVMHPFGYLKASTTLSCVNLFVLPYNYPLLLPILDELIKVHRLKQTPEWRAQFQAYLRSTPGYYNAPLRRALTRMGVPSTVVTSLVPDTADNASLSYSVLSYLKRLKTQAKTEYDRLCTEVTNKQTAKTNLNLADYVRVNHISSLKKDMTTNPQLQNKFIHLREQLNDFNNYVVGTAKRKNVECNKTGGSGFRNPFDISRSKLLEVVKNMQNNFSHFSQTRFFEDDLVHSMPVSQMGNYQEYLKRMTSPLREVESMPVRQHMFGNPFKIDKRMMVDEADVDMVGAGSGSSSPRAGSKRALDSSPTRRKPGPLPRHVCASPRPRSPSPAPFCPINSIVETPPILLPNGGETDEETPIPVNGECYPRAMCPSPPPPILEPYENNFNDDTDDDEIVPNDICNHVPVIPEGNAVRQHLLTITANMNQEIDELSKQELLDIKQHNAKVKKLLFVEVKRPGQNYTALFHFLSTLKGPASIQLTYVNDIIAEALRFKRKKLVNKLEEFRKSYMRIPAAAR
ncbi:unnamed protein product [Macrosiphum euphorbiae]|uniref:VWFA domain-containing protein n=1 Tax=Macrosiphum euphorbiae TaxID=13131 RepID=A0AAV0XHA6_9HEMI|nr:unnamed protein product [Macrosiphum euphorbiae]